MPSHRHLLSALLVSFVTGAGCDANGASPVQLTCPPIEDLFRNPNTHKWESKHYHGYWKSYSASFLRKISHFTGAQFIGNTQGNISCVYIGAHGSSAFPVVLHFGSLIHEPLNDHGLYKWQPLKRGWTNCISTDPTDCPFKPIVQDKTSPATLNKALDNIKRAPNLSEPNVPF